MWSLKETEVEHTQKRDLFGLNTIKKSQYWVSELKKLGPFEI